MVPPAPAALGLHGRGGLFFGRVGDLLLPLFLLVVGDALSNRVGVGRLRRDPQIALVMLDGLLFVLFGGIDDRQAAFRAGEQGIELERFRVGLDRVIRLGFALERELVAFLERDDRLAALFGCGLNRGVEL